MNTWTRIPANIPAERDRREIVGTLTDNGLEVRVRKIKIGTRYNWFIEYREQDGEDT